MTSPQTKADLIARLNEVNTGVAASVQAQSPEQFNRGTETEWSPANYLKHLLLSNKPFVKGLGRSKELLESAFGLTDRPSRTFEDVVNEYTARIAGGVRAEDSPTVVPITFRIPEGIADEQAYLIETWNATHANLIDVLGQWSEDELNRYQIPHPVMNLITVREMLFFTLHHNTIHWDDIQKGSAV